MPFISVIITAYNRKEYLKEAVDSVLTQTLPRDEYEIIVVKNFKDYDDYLKENGVKSIYTDRIPSGDKITIGIEESKGEVISFLDDDLFVPWKLEKVKSIFQDDNVVYYHNGFVNFTESKPTVGEYDSSKILKLSDNEKRKLRSLKLMHKHDVRTNNSSISIRECVQQFKLFETYS
ncbi:glycosyltransferase family 2 protein [Saccharolobus solfataricus]